MAINSIQNNGKNAKRLREMNTAFILLIFSCSIFFHLGFSYDLDPSEEVYLVQFCHYHAHPTMTQKLKNKVLSFVNVPQDLDNLIKVANESRIPKEETIFEMMTHIYPFRRDKKNTYNLAKQPCAGCIQKKIASPATATYFFEECGTPVCAACLRSTYHELKGCMKCKQSHPKYFDVHHFLYENGTYPYKAVIRPPHLYLSVVDSVQVFGNKLVELASHYQSVTSKDTSDLNYQGRSIIKDLLEKFVTIMNTNLWKTEYPFYRLEPVVRDAAELLHFLQLGPIWKEKGHHQEALETSRVGLDWLHYVRNWMIIVERVLFLTNIKCPINLVLSHEVINYVL